MPFYPSERAQAIAREKRAHLDSIGGLVSDIKSCIQSSRQNRAKYLC